MDNSFVRRLQPFFIAAGRYSRALFLRHRFLGTSLKALLVFIPLFVTCFCTLDLDFGWHLQAGNFFRAHGIPSHDIFSYTAPHFPWIDHEWGSDMLFSYLYHLPHGYMLLAAVFALLWTAGLLIYAARARLAWLLLATLVMIPYVTIRPTAWDVVGAAIVLKLLAARRPGRAIVWLPLLFLAWANLHGGFVLGLVILLYFALRRKSAALAYLLLICTLVTFINPYGPRLYVEIWRTLSDLSLHHQTVGMSMLNLQLPAWLLMGLWAVGFLAFDRKKTSYWLGLEPIFAAASLSATRYTVFFAILATSSLDRYYSRVKGLVSLSGTGVWGRRFIYALFTIVLALGYVAVIADRISPNREAYFPVKAVAYLHASPCRGRLFNDFNYGGYLIWKLPQEPVFIDGRMPSWRDPQGQKYLDKYFQVLNNAQAQRMVFNRYGIKCALLNKTTDRPMTGRLRAAGWKVRVDANNAVLLLAP